jgi:hypothetical protein
MHGQQNIKTCGAFFPLLLQFEKLKMDACWLIFILISHCVIVSS